MLRPFPLVLGTALLLVSPWLTAAQTTPAQTNPSQHVWTNADIDRLPTVQLPTAPSQNQSPGTSTARVYTNADTDRVHNEDAISTFVLGPTEDAEVNERTTPPQAVSPSSKFLLPRFNDPEWYAERATMLNTKLKIDEANLRNAEAGLINARNRRTQPGIDFFEGDIGLTPTAGIRNLAARVHDDEIQLNEFSDLARKNGIEPGVLRRY